MNDMLRLNEVPTSTEMNDKVFQRLFDARALAGTVEAYLQQICPKACVNSQSIASFLAIEAEKIDYASLGFGVDNVAYAPGLEQYLRGLKGSISFQQFLFKASQDASGRLDAVYVQLSNNGAKFPAYSDIINSTRVPSQESLPSSGIKAEELIFRKELGDKTDLLCGSRMARTEEGHQLMLGMRRSLNVSSSDSGPMYQRSYTPCINAGALLVKDGETSAPIAKKIMSGIVVNIEFAVNGPENVRQVGGAPVVIRQTYPIYVPAEDFAEVFTDMSGNQELSGEALLRYLKSSPKSSAFGNPTFTTGAQIVYMPKVILHTNKNDGTVMVTSKGSKKSVYACFNLKRLAP